MSGSLDVNYLTLAVGSDASQLTVSWQSAAKIAAPAVRVWTGDQQAVQFVGTSTDSVSSVSSLYSNHVTLTGLAADTTYTYQVGDGNGNWSVTHTTTTGNPDAYSYVVVGDPQIGASGNVASDTASWVNTMNVIQSNFPNVSFTVGTGDQIDSATSLAQQDGFFSPAQMTSLPFNSAMGNHEGNNAGPRSFFNPPNSDGVQDYWYRYGDTLYMVWNCNQGTPDTMKAFLQDAIDQNPDATWRVLDFHFDVYGQGSSHALSDGKAYRDQYVSVIDQFGIDVVFNGHDHSYSRSYPVTYSGSADTSNTGIVHPETFDANGASVNPTGTVYFTLDSASGSKYYSLVAQQPYTAMMAQSDRPQFTVVTMTATSFTATTYQIETTNTLTQVDTYTIVKPVTVVSATPAASVTQLAGNTNDLTITITEQLSNGKTNTMSSVFSIAKNSASTYTVGPYSVYVDTKGNTQIRDCHVV